MRTFALSAIGRDRPGIVAAVSAVLLEQRMNITDSQMTILGGHFAMTLLVRGADDVDEPSLRQGLESVRASLGLEAVSLSEVEEAADRSPDASHTVSVYGVDHPGIVHAVASLLAERGVDITDLTTRLVDTGEQEPLYAMMMEIALPAEVDEADLAGPLAEVGHRQGVEIVLRALERDAL